MKVSLNWLNEYVETAVAAEEIAEILSDLGFPCEGIEHLEGDAVIDVEVTSNRGDCLSHIGVARELAAGTGKELRLPEISLEEAEKPASEYCQVEINELLPEGAFGPDLSASFSFDVEGGTVVRIQDSGATLEHRKWYAIRNVGNWPGVAPFEIHYLVQMGDCDGDGVVISLDVGCVNAGIPCIDNCGDENRKDMDADGKVLSLDVGAVNAHLGSFAVPKPTGH